jgi:branched-chain amino acid transport system ATP-binding protein
MTEPIISCEQLNVGYGDLIAARNINLSVHRNEVVALIGPNGVGKTTTLLTLVGELPALGGRVYWEGRPTVAPLHVRARTGLSFVPQEQPLIMSMSVRDNIKVAQASEAKALELFPELGSLLGRRAGLLSGGEQRMLSIARSLSRNSSAVVVDELSLGLAPIIADRLALVLSQAAATGIAILVVEQNIKRALTLSDRFYLMRQGTIDLEAESASFRDQPDELAQMLVTA